MKSAKKHQETGPYRRLGPIASINLPRQWLTLISRDLYFEQSQSIIGGRYICRPRLLADINQSQHANLSRYTNRLLFYIDLETLLQETITRDWLKKRVSDLIDCTISFAESRLVKCFLLFLQLWRCICEGFSQTWMFLLTSQCSLQSFLYPAARRRLQRSLQKWFIILQQPLPLDCGEIWRSKTYQVEGRRKFFPVVGQLSNQFLFC